MRILIYLLRDLFNSFLGDVKRDFHSIVLKFQSNLKCILVLIEILIPYCDKKFMFVNILLIFNAFGIILYWYI